MIAGFGGMVPTAPLDLDSDEVQATAHEDYHLTRHNGDYILRAEVGGEWRGLYVFDLAPPAEIDYVVGNWYVCTHPDSPFLGQLFAARTGPGIRKTLNAGSFAIHRSGEPSERRELPDADAVIAVLRDELGVRVPDDPAVHEAIERRLAERKEG